MKRLFLLLTVISCTSALGQETGLSEKDWEKIHKQIDEYEGFVYVPTGLLRTNDYQTSYDQDVPFVYQNRKPRPPKIDSFYISKYEVTNFEYLEYIFWLNRPEEFVWIKKDSEYALEVVEKERGNVKEALPDSLGWRSPLGFGEKYVEYYFRHPAYRTYPVVNVSYEQAKKYCEWRTRQYNNSPYRTFEKVMFRLPTKNEWQRAALGGERPKETPLEGDCLFNEHGERLANIAYRNQLGIVSDTIKYVGSRFEADSTKHIALDIIVGAPPLRNVRYAVPKKMPQPYDGDFLFDTRNSIPFGYGLHHMAGNAEEMVEEIGVTLGGSWRDTGYFCRITTEQRYPDEHYSSYEMGFRMVMEVIEAKPKMKSKKMRSAE